MKSILFFFVSLLSVVGVSANEETGKVFGDWYVSVITAASGNIIVSAINPVVSEDSDTKFVVTSKVNDCENFTTQLAVPNSDTEDYTDPNFGFVRVLIDDEPIIGTPIKYVYKTGDDVAFMHMMAGSAPPKQGQKFWDYLSNHRVMRTELYTMTGGRYSEFFDIRQGKEAMDWLTVMCESYSGKAL